MAQTLMHLRKISNLKFLRHQKGNFNKNSPFLFLEKYMRLTEKELPKEIPLGKVKDLTKQKFGKLTPLYR